MLASPRQGSAPRRPAKRHKVTFSLSYFSVTKSTKSHQRERSPLFENSSRVHELVARSSAWQVRAANSRAKADSLALSAVSAIPRVRTYHTKKPSRFVHALSARPLKMQGGRGWSKYADGMESVFFIFSIDYTWVLVCRGRRRRHTLRVCINSHRCRWTTPPSPKGGRKL